MTDHTIGPDYVEAAPDPWRSGAPAVYPLPDNGKSWEECNKFSRETDKSRYKVWKDDVNNMLIFVSIHCH